MSNKQFVTYSPFGTYYALHTEMGRDAAGSSMVRFDGDGIYHIPEVVLQELAVQLLRSSGYVVIAPADVRLAEKS